MQASAVTVPRWLAAAGWQQAARTRAAAQVAVVTEAGMVTRDDAAGGVRLWHALWLCWQSATRQHRSGVRASWHALPWPQLGC